MATRTRKQWPKTGEKRKAEQPLKIDRLPVAVHDEILRLRNVEGRTWEEIEELSSAGTKKSFVPWADLPVQTLELFPDMRVPHTNLHRWYDLRYRQIVKRNREEAAFARELAAAFRGMGFDQLDQSVQNALAKEIFLLGKSAAADDKKALRSQLLKMASLLAYEKRTEIQKQRAAAEAKRVELLEQELNSKQRKLEKETDAAAAKLGKGRSLTLDDINKIRERTFGLPAIGGSDAA